MRECNEIIFKVPFQSELPYLNTGNTGTGSSTGKSFFTGQVNVYVEDILTAPPTVNSTISFILEIAGGQDIEFAYPCPNFQQPTLGVTPQMGERSPRNDCALNDDNLAMFSAEDQIEASSKCIGERIRSFRSLMKAYQIIQPTTSETPALYWNILPFFSACRFQQATPVAPSYNGDLYSALHGVYLYSRGGVRYLLDQKDYATANAQSADKDFKVTVVRYLLQASVTSPIQSAATVQGKLTPAQYSGNGLKVLSRIAQGAPVQFSVPALNQTIPRVCSEYLIDVSVPTNTADRKSVV